MQRTQMSCLQTGLILLLLLGGMRLHAQPAAKPAIGQEDIDNWKTLDDELLSPDGRYVVYERNPNLGDGELVLVNVETMGAWTFPRGSRPSLSSDGRFLVFQISPPFDSLRAMRRRGVEKDSLPPDTLAIYDIQEEDLVRIGDVDGFSLPEKWPGWVAYEREEEVKAAKEKKLKELTLRDLLSGEEQVVKGVSSYVLAEEAPRLLIARNPVDSGAQDGVWLFDGTQASMEPLLETDGEFAQLALSKNGDQAAFLADRDTTQARVRPQELFAWKEGQDEAGRVAGPGAEFLPEEWRISGNGDLKFSDDGSKLYFGIAPQPILEDTTLLEEEVVQVEVWSYNDKRLYTQQEVEKDEDEKRAYPAVWYTADNDLVALGDEQIPRLIMEEDADENIALGVDTGPYELRSSWSSYRCRDLYKVDLRSGARTLLASGICGTVRLSPAVQYAYWYSSPDSAWFALDLGGGEPRQLTDNTEVPFFDETNDRPMHPNDYGVAGWTEGDANVLIYDRYDIWKVDPAGQEGPVRLTNGRPLRRTFRYVQLDPEETQISLDSTWLLHMQDDSTRREGYAWYDPEAGSLDFAQEDDYRYNRRVTKAKEAEAYLFTREDFQTFPDLLYSDDRLKSFVQVSEANPQQGDFRWGSIERYFWTGANGEELEGLVIKPEGFDPEKKYPAIVYFYERYSDNLHRYWTPEHGRSIINFPVYASRGYVIFIPDIIYQTGYPGKSAYDAVMPGISSLMADGYIDKERIGLQGHSWGGYQSAYLISQTDLFACAESGAPVVNMISAYGGIRWGSGYSRMFQYEQTQSRIGGTLWEYPMRYIENSPIFYADQINTPVLILHNDEDGAVPWYQGIEFFVAMRRLGKPAWMLNYNGEPHWPLKYQNRKDFQLRMQQFFDHYLLDAPKPRWMEEGVSPLEKGIEQGYEAVGNKVSDRNRE